MLNQKTIASIAALLKVEPAVLTAAIKDEKEVSVKVKGADGAEVDFDHIGLHVLTDAELAARDTNVKETSRQGFIDAGKEIVIKELKTKAGITLEGKDPDKFLSAVQAKALEDAKIKPDAKVKELEDQIALLKASSGSNDAKVAELQRQLDTERLDKSILTHLPPRNSAISDEDYLLLVKARIQPETVDGKVVYKNASGEVIRDTKSALPKGLKDVIVDVFASSPAWAPTQEPGKGGRGGGNSGSGGSGGTGETPTSYSAALKEWTASGKSANSAEFSTFISKLQTDNKDFVLDIDKVESTAGE
jgi:hypothetical protein